MPVKLKNSQIYSTHLIFYRNKLRLLIHLLTKRDGVFCPSIANGTESKYFLDIYRYSNTVFVHTFKA